MIVFWRDDRAEQTLHGRWRLAVEEGCSQTPVRRTTRAAICSQVRRRRRPPFLPNRPARKWIANAIRWRPSRTEMERTRSCVETQVGIRAPPISPSLAPPCAHCVPGRRSLIECLDLLPDEELLKDFAPERPTMRVKAKGRGHANVSSHISHHPRMYVGVGAGRHRVRGCLPWTG